MSSVHLVRHPSLLLSEQVVFFPQKPVFKINSERITSYYLSWEHNMNAFNLSWSLLSKTWNVLIFIYENPHQLTKLHAPRTQIQQAQMDMLNNRIFSHFTINKTYACKLQLFLYFSLQVLFTSTRYIPFSPRNTEHISSLGKVSSGLCSIFFPTSVTLSY